MTNESTVQEGAGKGEAFFRHAKTVAGSGNYDYAITLFIDGLQREPQNVEQHKALYDISLRRKASGGKPAGGLFGPKLPCKGKTAKDHMLNAEWQLANDPGNISHMLTLLRQAAAAEYPEVIRWFVPILLLANRAKPKKDIYLEIADIMEKLNEPDDLKTALECIRNATELAPNDMGLVARGKDLGAKLTLIEGQYDKDKDFKQSIRDKERTKELLEEENLAKSEDYRIKLVNRAKEDYEKNPQEHQIISKYGKALANMDQESYENQAVEVYEKAYVETKTYRYKAYAGDIRMKQFSRKMRGLQEAAKANPADKSLVQQLHDVAKQRLAFELQEYKERIEHYPTDMQFQYEYGVRLYQAKRFDEAIGALQIAQNNPRHRAQAQHLLGRAFFEQGLKPEAIDTLRRAIENYEQAGTGDTKSKEYHYWLARALEDTGSTPEAISIYSKIMQWDYNYRDVRGRLETLRKKAG